MTPEQRRERQRLGGRIGALKLHATGGTNTAPARAAQAQALARLVDPDLTLPEPVRAERVAMLRRARMLALSLRSAQARAARKRAG